MLLYSHNITDTAKLQWYNFDKKGDFLIYEVLGNYGFHFLSDMDNPPIKLQAVGIEKRDSKDYYFDNRNRTESYLFQYTLSGSGTVEIDGALHHLDKGKAFFLALPGTEKYYFDEKKNEAPWHFIYIMLSGDAAAKYYNFINKKFGKILTLSENAPCISALTEIFSLAQRDLITDSFTGERLAFDFICRLCSSCFTPETDHSKLVFETIRIIKHEFSSLEGIAEISERLGVTQNHLSRLFSSETKMTPMAFLTKTRLQKAINLLSLSHISIEEVAKECGFSCGNYFCKVFFKHMGTSPLKYRIQTKSASYDNIKI